MAEPDESPHAVADDPLPEALTLARAAEKASIGLKLLGGLAVRVLTPDLPPRLRAGQDMDFACMSKGRKATAAFLEENGCEPDRRFNNLNGDRQMYFVAPSGRPIDVMVDRLTMCHVLDFRSGYGRLPFTLDAIDILLSKLQIVELNEKDARDIFQLLSGLPVRPAAAAQPGEVILDTERFGQLLGADWGWWRTVTGNLDKLPGLAAEKPELVPRAAPHDPLEHAARLADHAHAVPKGMRWKLRANVGDRVRWYELPEEVGH
ncbi:MAG TPA: hypothetical protein VEV61_07900 [Streptosporangiaceae bacterium]|nr:hypothetical protein [Streptosporangiaceae bacterium]